MLSAATPEGIKLVSDDFVQDLDVSGMVITFCIDMSVFKFFRQYYLGLVLIYEVLLVKAVIYAEALL